MYVLLHWTNKTLVGLTESIFVAEKKSRGLQQALKTQDHKALKVQAQNDTKGQEL